MNKQAFIFLVFIFFFSSIALAQDPIVDTTQIYKEYKRIIPKMEFDSARVSPNGKYALILKGNSLGDCYINYWNLYENGLNKTIAEYIVILKDTAYFVTYEKEGITDKLTYFQNDELFSWKLTKKCLLKDFLKEYNLSKKPKNRTNDLKIIIERLPDFKVKIPWEYSNSTVGSVIEKSAQRFELKFKYNDKLIYSTPVQYLAEPEFYSTPEKSFEVYCSEIQKQLKQSNYLYSEGSYGVLFLESDGISFLTCKIETTFFSGWYYDVNYSTRIASPGSDPRGQFILLSKTE